MTKGILWIVLSEESKEKLLTVIPPRYPVVFAHHITLFYDVELSLQQKKLLGTKQVITLKQHSYNERIQAVTVTIKITSQNTAPHITISALDGIKPFESNSMLQKSHTSFPVPSSLELKGIVEFKAFK